MDINSAPAPEMNYYCTVQIKPDNEEKKSIRWQYTKTAIVIIINILIFNVVLKGLLRLGCGLYMGDMSKEGVNAGFTILSENSTLLTLVSIGIPIISEIISIIIGFKWMKIDLKGMLTRNNYNGSTILKLVTLSLGLQTAAAFISVILAAIIEAAGFQADLPDLSADFSSPLANVMMYSYACLLGPVLEELLYRGFLLQSLRKYNERMAIFVSALIFGLMHQNYQQFILGFLIGIPLAVVTIKCGSIIPAIIAHIVVNTSNTVFQLLMAYTSPSEYQQMMSGDISDTTSYSTNMMSVVMLSGLWRILVAAAGLVVGIVVLAKGNNMSKPTSAGKSRGLPILITSWAWIIIFAIYLYYNVVTIFL